jgi:hypothetical protein
MLFSRRFAGVAILLGILAPGWTSAQELSWAAKMFEKQSVDFGVVARGADTRYRLNLENLYKEQVHIADVRTSCGCAAATISNRTLASREKAYIEISMDTERFVRRKDSNVIVTFDAPQYAEVRIPVTAYIRTDVVLTPGAANFGSVPVGESAEKKIEVAYAGRADWKISQVKSPHDYIQIVATETLRNGGRVNYDLNISLSDDAPVGLLQEQLTIVTDDSNSPHVPLLLVARIVPDIEVTPNVLAMGRMSSGSAKRMNLVVKGLKPFAISGVESASQSDGVNVTVPAGAKPVHILPVSITAPADAGAFEDHLVIRIEGREEPVKVRVYGESVR